jgi:Spy/CpxP family protein refolding chaperone
MRTHRNLRWTAMLLTAGLLIAASAAIAQDPQSGKDVPAAGPRPGQICQRLELTDAQQQAWSELREKGQQERVALRKDLMRLRNDLRGEMLKDEPSAAKVKDLVGRVGELRTKMQQSRMSQRLEMRKLLTPAQRDRLLLMGQDRGRGHGRGMRDFRGPGRAGRAGRGGSWDGSQHRQGPGGHGRQGRPDSW